MSLLQYDLFHIFQCIRNNKIFIQSDLGHCISFPPVHMYLLLY